MGFWGELYPHITEGVWGKIDNGHIRDLCEPREPIEAKWTRQVLFLLETETIINYLKLEKILLGSLARR